MVGRGLRGYSHGRCGLVSVRQIAATRCYSVATRSRQQKRALFCQPTRALLGLLANAHDGGYNYVPPNAKAIYEASCPWLFQLDQFSHALVENVVLKSHGSNTCGSIVAAAAGEWQFQSHGSAWVHCTDHLLWLWLRTSSEMSCQFGKPSCIAV